jgi:hypothetical protein
MGKNCSLAACSQYLVMMNRLNKWFEFLRITPTSDDSLWKKMIIIEKIEIELVLFNNQIIYNNLLK